MRRILCIIAFVAIIGCVAHSKPQTVSVGDSLAKIQGYSQVVRESLGVAIQQATGIVEENIVIATSANDKIASEAAAAKKANEGTAKYISDLEAKYNAEHNGRWAKIGRFISFAWKLLVGVLGFGLILRIASMFVGGGAGRIMSLASTGIFGVFTGGISIVQSWFDHKYLNDRQDVLNPPWVIHK